MGLGRVPANWMAGALRVCQTHVQHLGELPRQAGRGNVKANCEQNVDALIPHVDVEVMKVTLQERAGEYVVDALAPQVAAERVEMSQLAL